MAYLPKIAEFDPTTAENWIRQWAAWAKDNRHYSHCMSIEHRYRPPPCWEPPEPKKVVDVLLAQQIQDCIHSLISSKRMSAKQAKLLKMVYILKFSDWAIWRRLRIKEHRISNEINQIMWMLWRQMKILDEQKEKDYKEVTI